MLIHHMDVRCAFLNGDLEQTLYMAQPEGFKIGGKVWLLKKSIYGLKQSPRCWHTNIDSVLQGIGLTKSSNDPCLYVGLDMMLKI